MPDTQLVEKRVRIFCFSEELYQIWENVDEFDDVRCIFEMLELLFLLVFKVELFVIYWQLEMFVEFLNLLPNGLLIFSAEVKGIQAGVR